MFRPKCASETESYSSKVTAQSKNYDILYSIHERLENNTLTWSFQNVYGHQDDNISWESLSPMAKLNMEADNIAKNGVHISQRNQFRWL